jgi:hypothetical protein
MERLAGYPRHPREMIAEIATNGQLDWLPFLVEVWPWVEGLLFV